MRPETSRLAVGVLATLLVAGCGTASTSRDAWLYVGPDKSLENPPAASIPALRREVAAERRHNPSGELSKGLQARLPEDFAAWRSRLLAALNADRSACVLATGDSGERHFWSGYDPAFLQCMGTKGWSRPIGSNPL